jgi:crotonobetainyl-CoA:carnitine CoA-transferase CaiB-like acyl-CoA transferase
MLDLLEGIRIVSFTHFVFGPMGIQALGDIGAEVIAVEPLTGCWQRHWGGADNRMVAGQSVLSLAVDRNKRSIAIDLKKPQGMEIVRKIISTADVLATNFRPGVLEKLGLGYEALKREDPRLIYAAATGYGPDGPYVSRPGQDLLVQAMSGLATITGPRDCGPRPVGVSAVDHHGAALLALGIVSALFRRERTGRGCRVDISLLSAAIDLQMEGFTCYLNGPCSESVAPPKWIGGWHYEAPYGIYPTADGHMAISKTTAEWLEILEQHGIWHAPANDYEAVAKDPQVQHIGSFVTITGASGEPITLVAHPIRYDGKAPEVRLPPQPIGAQTAEILEEMGYTAREIDDLERRDVVRRGHGTDQFEG